MTKYRLTKRGQLAVAIAFCLFMAVCALGVEHFFQVFGSDIMYHLHGIVE